MITHQLRLRNAQDYSLNVHFFSYLKVLVCYKTISIIQGVFRLGTYVCLKTCRVLKVIVYYYHVITIYGHFFITILFFFSFPKAYLLLLKHLTMIELLFLDCKLGLEITALFKMVNIYVCY